MTALHDYGYVLGWPSDAFYWALTISCAQLLAHALSGPYNPIGLIRHLVK